LPQAEVAKFHPGLKFVSHVDMVPTWMDFLQLDPPLPPSLYSDGMSLLWPRVRMIGVTHLQLSARSLPLPLFPNLSLPASLSLAASLYPAAQSREDTTDGRLMVMTPRYFPEKNKVVAIATYHHKFWFRVTVSCKKSSLLACALTFYTDAAGCGAREVQGASHSRVGLD
jgi:hypothetical protein